MELIYYRNFDPKCFYRDAEFNLHSDFIVETQENGKDEKGNLKISLNIQKHTENSPYENLKSITSSKIIVGENGVGKTTVIDDIIYCLGQTSSYFKDFLIISKNFIYYGKSIILESDSIRKLKEIFPEINIITSADLNDAGKSFFQAYDNKNYKLISYTNSFRPTYIASELGEPATSSQKFDVGYSYIDISVQNDLILSNTFGLKSEIKYLLKENSLLTLDSLLTSRFLTCYSTYGWFKDLIPKNIIEKLKIKVSYASSYQKLINYIHIERIYQEFPSLNRCLDFILGDKYHHNDVLDREIILSILLNRIDQSHFKNLDNGLRKIVLEELKRLNHEIDFHNIQSLTIINDDELISKIKAMRAHLIKISPFETLHDDSPFEVDFMKQSENIKNLSYSINNLIKNESDKERISINLIKLEISNLSSGERNFIYTLANLIDRIGVYEEQKEENSVRLEEKLYYSLFLDEPANDFHPEWQRTYISKLYDLLEGYNKIFPNTFFQIITTSHSPFFLSDFTNNNVIRLYRKEEDNEVMTKIKTEAKETFGANIYDLFKDSFFMEKGYIGEYAKEKITDIIRYLTFDNSKNESDKNIKPLVEWTPEKTKEVIASIGEPILKIKLAEMYDEKFKIDFEVELLQQRINEINESRTE